MAYNRITMNLSLLHSPILRLIGISSWLIASVPTVFDVLRHPHQTTAARLIVWAIAFGLFGLSFWITSSATSDFTCSRRIKRSLHVPLIALQTAVTLVMVYLIPCYSIGILLVIVAWQLPLLLSSGPMAHPYLATGTNCGSFNNSVFGSSVESNYVRDQYVSGLSTLRICHCDYCQTRVAGTSGLDAH